METYHVYIKIDSDNHIIAINSSAFIDDTDGWIMIASGATAAYQYAQGNYLEKSIVDANGRYNYKYVNDTIVDNDDEDEEVNPAISLEERISDLEVALCEIIENMT